MYPGLGHVADAGVTRVTPGVSQGRVLDQQERGGRGAWNMKVKISMFAVNPKQLEGKLLCPIKLIKASCGRRLTDLRKLSNRSCSGIS